MGGFTQAPEAMETGLSPGKTKVIYRQVEIYATGFVSETTRGVDFDWGNTPTIRRDLVVLVTIATAN